jgi:hypothetical protein
MNWAIPPAYPVQPAIVIWGCVCECGWGKKKKKKKKSKKWLSQNPYGKKRKNFFSLSRVLRDLVKKKKKKI